MDPIKHAWGRFKTGLLLENNFLLQKSHKTTFFFYFLSNNAYKIQMFLFSKKIHCIALHKNVFMLAIYHSKVLFLAEKKGGGFIGEGAV